MRKTLLGTPVQIDIGLLFLRIAFGLLMMVHGIQKIMAFEKAKDVFPDPIGLGSQLSLIMAILTETGGSLLLLFGALTRINVIPLAFTMIVAAFIHHGDNPWEKKELGVLYLVVYVVLFITGPGRYSLDHWLANRNKI